MHSFIALLATLALAASAQAHVTANPGSVVAGSYSATAFRVGHGCSGSPTIGLTVKIPSGVSSVKGLRIAGWTVSATTRPDTTPGAAANATTPDTITWTIQADSTNATAPLGLSDIEYQDFGLSFKAPGIDASPLYFPITQTCANATQPWTDIPVAGQPEPAHPAAALNLTATAAGSAASQSSGATPSHQPLALFSIALPILAYGAM